MPGQTHSLRAVSPVIERGVYDPELFAEGEYNRQRATEISQATGEKFGVKENDTFSAAGIRQTLPTGTRLEATVEHERGASTSLLVAQAQRDLLAAQIAEVEALVNYLTALIELYLAEGSLLERRGIRLAAGKSGGSSFN